MEKGGERNDKLIDEIQELRREFREYQRTVDQHNANRRVENVQILVAIAIVGAVVTMYSSGTIEKEPWQGIVNSPYWSTTLKFFVGSNLAFLLLKLITVPLVSSLSHKYISFVHDQLEPFLYFFAILGLLSSLIVRVALSPVYMEFGMSMREIVAGASLIVPMVLALIYARANRISTIIKEYSTTLYLISEVMEDLEETDRISANTSAILSRQILLTFAPPSLISILYDIIKKSVRDTLDVFFPLIQKNLRITHRLSNKSLRGMNNIIETAVIMVPSRLFRLAIGSIQHLIAAFGTGIGKIMSAYTKAILQIVYYLTPELHISDGSNIDLNDLNNTTEEEREQLQRKLEEIRAKQFHGNLDEEDIRELQDLIEDISKENKTNPKQREDPTTNDNSR